MAKEKKEINNETLPIPIDERFCVYLKKKNGEWAKYEYKDVRSKVDPDGHYKVMLSGEEFLLRNGLKFPKKEWKQIIYQEILGYEEFSMWEKACNKHLNSRDLNRLIKHRWVYLEEKDDKTIEIKADGICIMDKIESQMQYNYTDEFWKRWYNRYVIKNKTRINIRLAVYDRELGVTIDKKDIENYYSAAKLVTDRLNAYTLAYKKRRSEHEIALMTMVDLALMRKNIDNIESK